ncbi:MAG: SDR family oxidoreductase [Anaerolineales bacterium]|nr:SDR family oxidoreductase [Anaerolineales bacterium]
MELGLKGKVALVTGSGRGIGKHIALALAKEGVSIAVNDVNAANASSTTNEITNLDIESKPYCVDITHYPAVIKMVEDIVEDFGRLDILINNAGISIPAPIQETTIEQWKQVIDVNLNGVFYCSKAVFPFMQNANSGRIVNIASFAGKRGTLFGNNISYATTKAAVMGLTVSLAIEAARYGITVNAIAPGVVETDLLKSVHSKEKRQEIAAYTLLKRLASPDEIATLAIFLVSDASAYMTGEIVDINGGLLLDL